MFALVFLLVLSALDASARLVQVSDSVELGSAVSNAVAGDEIQLAAGTYDLAQTLSIDKSLQLSSAPGGSRAILRAASSSVDVLVAIRADDVVLRDLVVGRSVLANARLVDVFVDAGTHREAPLASGGYAAQITASARSSALNAVHATASDTQHDAATDVGANRALRNFVLNNVDFSTSRAAINIAFDNGAYLGTSLVGCVFSNSASATSIVTVRGARFADSGSISGNSFGSAPLALAGFGFGSLAANFWSDVHVRPTNVTYCVSRHCLLLGPVVDGDRAGVLAFLTVADALNAGVRNVVITESSVPLGGAASVKTIGTTLSSHSSLLGADDCGAEPPTIVLDSATDSIESRLGALSVVRDLRFELRNDAQLAISFVDDSSGSGVSDSVVLSRISVIGSGDDSVGVSLTTDRISVSIVDSFFSGVGTAVALSSGALLIADSAFVAHSRAAIVVSGSGTGTGISVSGSLFAATPKGSIVFSSETRSARLVNLFVACSRFVDAPLYEPTDCSGALCAAALSHNTFIEHEEQARAGVNRRFLLRGGNHVERVSTARLDDFVQLARAGAHSVDFELDDSQGRLDAVRASVDGLGGAAVSVGSYIPMRQECFADSLPTDVGEAPRVVSNVWQLASDARPACISVALRFGIADVAATQHDADDLSVYGVAAIGDSANGGAVWTRAASVVARATLGSGAVVEAAGGAGSLVRAAVIAAHANDEERAASLSAGVTSGLISVGRADHQLCVVCGSDERPEAHLLDERCGGGADDASLFSNFDKAFDAALAASANGDSASLLVYGSQCVTDRCTLDIARGASAGVLTIEGVSVAKQSAVRRSAQCASSHAAISVSGSSSASLTLRFLLVAPQSGIESAIPQCAVQLDSANVRLAFSSLSGGVCVSSSAESAVLIGNEISTARGEPAVHLDGVAGALVEGNTLGGSGVELVNGATRARLDRNSLRSTAALALRDSSDATLSVNEFAERAELGGSCFSVEEGSSLSSTNDLYGTNCVLSFRGGPSGKLRISATALNKAAAWRDVRLSVGGGSRDVRISGIALLGRNSAIGVLDGVASSVVLHNVGLDLAESSVADALVGADSDRSECARAHEAAVGGFSLVDSVIVDVTTSRRLLTAQPHKTDQYLDSLSGELVSCASAPATSDYCACVAPTTAESVIKQTVATDTLPKKQGFFGDSNRKSAQPLAAHKNAGQQLPGQAAARAQQQNNPHRVAVSSADDDDDDTSVFVQLLPLWIVLGVCLLCALVIGLFLCASGAGVGSETGNEAFVAVGAAASSGGSLAVSIDSDDTTDVEDGLGRTQSVRQRKTAASRYK